MTTAPIGAADPSFTQDPETAIAALESCLDALAAALQQRDGARLERCAAELHQALAEAVQMSAQAARCGGLAPALRQRLSSATGRIAAQRETLAQATAALDRAIEVLMPGPPVSSGNVPPEAAIERTAEG